MIEYTPDQLMFVESFVSKRDELTRDVGMLTHEKDILLRENKNLSDVNDALQKDINDVKNNASKIAFECSEKASEARIELIKLQLEVEKLKERHEFLTNQVDEKNTSLRNLGLVITSIGATTQNTIDHIASISNKINGYTSRIEAVANTANESAEKIKACVVELSTTIDNERKVNYLKTKEIDDRENGVILRERLLKSKE